ncbi:minor tail protein [Arthrobacter phage Hirko]|nr:minor tail protein [Arthrobacter phage Hirko]
MNGLSTLRTPGRDSSGRGTIPSVWRGIIVETYDDGTVAALVPSLFGDQAVRMPTIVTGLLQGASVIVGAVEGRRDDLVVMAALNADGTIVGPGRFTTVELTNAPTLPSHAVSKGYADALGSVTAAIDSIVRRGSTGSIIVQDAYLGGVQTAGNAATTKTYVDAQVAGRYEKTLTALPSTAHDLNNYTTAGNFHQAANAAAALSTNYPSALAGLLEVFVSGVFVYQRYTYYNSGITVTRTKYNSTWYAWKEHSTVGHTHAYSTLTGLPATFPSDWATLANIPATFAPSAHTHAAATASVDGFMSAADKTKLDGATSSPTLGALAMRHATAGTIQVLTGTNANDAANKGYVDTQVATRAATAHTHAALDISDASTVGRNVLKAVDAAAARTAIGAGTSSLIVGTGATNAMAGNKTFAYSEITGTVPTSALPPLAMIETTPVASQAAMLALPAQRGDVAIRTDLGKTFILSTDSPGTLADWKEMLAPGVVTSVAGRVGAVTLAKADVGLSNVDNTTDAAKPISTATASALAGKAATAHNHDGGDITTGTISDLRIANATSTLDGLMPKANKALIDTATYLPTGSSLVQRHSSGSIQVVTGTSANDAANKAYVDAAAAADHTFPKLRLTSTGDASATSTSHAFQIGPDTGLNLRIDQNEIVGANNGVGAEVYFAYGVTSGIAPAGSSSLTRKDYVDARMPFVLDKGTASISILTNEYFKTIDIVYGATFATAPNVVATITSNVAGRAAQLNVYAYNKTTTGCTLKIMTNDVANIGTGYTILVDWQAIGT